MREPVSQRYAEGTVVREDGTLPLLLRSNGALFGNESVRLSEATYILHIQRVNGLVYVAQVYNDRNGRSIDLLASAIDSGSFVRFPITCPQDYSHNKVPCFNDDHIGTVPASDVSLLKKSTVNTLVESRK